MKKSGVNKDYLSAYNSKWLHAKIWLVMKALETDFSVLGTNKIRNNWQKCCKMAMEFGQKMKGSDFPKNWNTVRNWNAEFCMHGVFLINIAKN